MLSLISYHFMLVKVDGCLCCWTSTGRLSQFSLPMWEKQGRSKHDSQLHGVQWYSVRLPMYGNTILQWIQLQFSPQNVRTDRTLLLWKTGLSYSARQGRCWILQLGKPTKYISNDIRVVNSFYSKFIKHPFSFIYFAYFIFFQGGGTNRHTFPNSQLVYSCKVANLLR